MNEKRFTTVELPKPNKWGIWFDGACLSTYQVCILLNEYVDCRIDNETLMQRNNELGNRLKQKEKEIIDIKNTIKTMMENERTHIGHNVLKQLWEAIQ